MPLFAQNYNIVEAEMHTLGIIILIHIFDFNIILVENKFWFGYNLLMSIIFPFNLTSWNKVDK